MSTRASGTPLVYQALTETGDEASLGMTVVLKITSAHQASTETGRGASSAIATSALSEEQRGEPAMVETFTPRVGADTSSSKVDETSHDGRSRTPIVWGQGIPLRPSMKLPPPTNSESRPSTSRTISQASVSEAISRLQREKAGVQQTLDRCKAEHTDLCQRFDKLLHERDHLAKQDKEMLDKTLVTVRQKLEESRAATTAARVAEEAGRQQLARMMDEQLVQSQTIESLRRQLETSNNATRDAQAF